MLHRALVISLMLGISSSAFSRVLIFTYAYNRPDFIEIQARTLKKFFLDEYQFIVFSDAKEEPHISGIKETCDRLGIQMVPIPQQIHREPYLERFPGEDLNAPSVRNANAVQYSLHYLGYAHDDIVMLLDSDLFLVRPFSAREFLNGFSLSGLRQNRDHIDYLWIGLALLDMKTMPNKNTINFNCGIIDGVHVDSGGYTHHYLKNNPDAKVRDLGYFNADVVKTLFCDDSTGVCQDSREWLLKEGFDPNQVSFLQTARDMEFFGDKTFLHYRAGTNWNYLDADYHRRKTEALKAYMDAILTGNN